MGIYDREYYQEDGSQQSLFGAIRNWPWSYRMIGFYVVLFFLDHLIPATTSMGGKLGSNGFFTEWFMYTSVQVFQGGQVWRILSSLLIEVSPNFLLFSMIGLFFFGPMIENMLGRPKFLLYFVLCHIGGVLIGTVLSGALLHSPTFFAGSGAGVMGLVVAAGVLVPHQTAVFMFVLPMTMYWLAIVSVGIDAAFAISGSFFAMCYIAAAFTGFVLLKTRVALNWIDRVPMLSRGQRNRVGSFPATVPFSKIGSAFAPKPVSEEELDRLLDKVHEHGIESLTTREKSTLKRAAKQRRNR